MIESTSALAAQPSTFSPAKSSTSHPTSLQPYSEPTSPSQIARETSRAANSPNSGYDPAFFAKLNKLEESHFWFRARRRAVGTLLCQLTARFPDGYKVLELGCGNGGMLRLLQQCCPGGHVFGMDIHPVAVTFARVTYLLAIGAERLQAPDRPAISVPVYLGDSIQWGQERTLFTANALVVPTTSAGELWSTELRFPASAVTSLPHLLT